MEKSITQMFDEKHKRIQEYRSETQLSIQLGQAINLAVEWMTKNGIGIAELNTWVNFFMEFLDKKRKEVFDENNRMFKENPVPTVEQWENMTPVQQKFYKDKQLEANRKKYAERKNMTEEEKLAERVAIKQKRNAEEFMKELEIKKVLNEKGQNKN